MTALVVCAIVAGCGGDDPDAGNTVDPLGAELRDLKAPPVLFHCAAGDLARSRERLDSSIYAEALALLPDELHSMAEHATGDVSLSALLSAARAAVLRFDAAELDAPQVSGSIALGSQLDPFWSLLTARKQPEDGVIRGDPFHLRRADGQLCWTTDGGAPVPFPADTGAADLRVSIDLPGFADKLRATGGDEELTMATALAPYGALHYAGRIVPSGIEDTIVCRFDRTHRPLDRAIFTHCDDKTLAVVAMSLDGPVVAEDLERLDPEVRREFSRIWGQFGLPGTAMETVKDINGTAAIWIRRSQPFPSVTLALPRSAATDALAAWAGDRFDQQLPAAGTAALVALPPGALPVPLAMGRSEDHWLLSTDIAAIESWFTASDGWADSAALTTALAQAGEHAYIIGASDTPALAEIGQGYLGLALAQLDPAEAERIRSAVAAIVPKLDTGYIVADHADDILRVHARGIFGSGLMTLGVLPAIALPNLLESRTAANESAAANTLRSGIFAGQVTWQGSAFNDQDQDNIGEFGFLPQLAGIEQPFTAEIDGLALIGPGFGDDEPRYGYHFRVYLPDGAGGMIDYPTMKQRVEAGTLSQKAIDACERHFVCYAWPAHPGETGMRAFAITEQGQVHVADATAIELPPAWNAVNPDASSAAELLDDPAWVPQGSLRGLSRPRPEPVERLVRFLIPARSL